MFKMLSAILKGNSTLVHKCFCWQNTWFPNKSAQQNFASVHKFYIGWQTQPQPYLPHKHKCSHPPQNHKTNEVRKQVPLYSINLCQSWSSYHPVQHGKDFFHTTVRVLVIHPVYILLLPAFFPSPGNHCSVLYFFVINLSFHL